MTPREPLPLGARIGILGSGQLGRMSAMAAARLGFRPHVFGPEADGPGMQVACARTVAAYEDTAALHAFAAAVDVVTFEFENVPAATLAALAGRVECRPGLKALATCQDRVAEKRFLESVGVPVAPWREVTGLEGLREAIAALGLPAVLKTTRMGYDGRGQAVIRAADEAEAAFARLAPHPLVLEGFVPFTHELSAVAARGADGALAVFEASENRHVGGILDVSLVPAGVPAAAAAEARRLVARVAEGLELVGVVALEMFLLPDGRLLANEIAPRPHNSGHWTMDACACSQFEQHVRAVAGLPLGPVARHAAAVEMRNLIGPAGLDAWPGFIARADAVCHWYGKEEARQGRKLGHVNLLRG